MRMELNGNEIYRVESVPARIGMRKSMSFVHYVLSSWAPIKVLALWSSEETINSLFWNPRN